MWSIRVIGFGDVRLKKSKALAIWIYLQFSHFENDVLPISVKSQIHVGWPDLLQYVCGPTVNTGKPTIIIAAFIFSNPNEVRFVNIDWPMRFHNDLIHYILIWPIKVSRLSHQNFGKTGHHSPSIADGQI